MAVKDFLGSFLPSRYREKVVDPGYKEVTKAETELELEFRSLVRQAYARDV